jgi:hypothetical protein
MVAIVRCTYPKELFLANLTSTYIVHPVNNLLGATSARAESLLES